MGLLGPVLDLDDKVALLLRGDSLCDCALTLRSCCHSIQVVKKSCAIRQREEEASLVGHVDHFLRVSLLFLLGHCLGQVSDLEVGCATGRHNKCGLAGEESLAAGTLGADRWVNGPFTILTILDRHSLISCFPDDSFEVQLLSLRAFLNDTLAHHSEADWLTSLDGARDLLGDALIHVLGVESDLQVKVRVGIHIAAGW